MNASDTHFNATQQCGLPQMCSSAGALRLIAAATAAFLLLTGLTPAQSRLFKKENREIPEIDLNRYPKNLARHHYGSSVEIVGESPEGRDLKLSEKIEDRNESHMALLADDPTVGYPLVEGRTDILVEIEKIDVLRRIQFINLETQGTVAIHGSTKKLDHDDPEWIQLLPPQPIDGQSLVNFEIPPSEVRHVRLRFDITQTGRISGFTKFGETSVADFIDENDHPLGGDEADRTAIDHDYSSLYSGASIHYMSSVENIDTIPLMIDESPLTSSSFAPDDEEPLVVIDLGRPQPLNRVSLITGGQPGVTEIYLRETRGDEGIPGDPVVVYASPGKSGPMISKNPVPRNASSQAAMARTSMQPAGEEQDPRWEEYAPVARIEDDQGVMRKSAIFDDSFARFILIRFRPDNRVQTSGPFTIYDISAFGEPSKEDQRLGAAIIIEPLSSTIGIIEGVQPEITVPADDPVAEEASSVPPVSP